MTDIVERLRSWNEEPLPLTSLQPLLLEAADEIERLLAENIALIETLKQPDQVGYWQRKYELCQVEIERLRTEIEHLHTVIAEYGDICAAQARND